MGTDASDLERIRGDVQHWLNPKIGHLRMNLFRGEALTPDDIEAAIRAMCRALSAFDLPTYREQFNVEIPETPRPTPESA